MPAPEIKKPRGRPPKIQQDAAAPVVNPAHKVRSRNLGFCRALSIQSRPKAGASQTRFCVMQPPQPPEHNPSARHFSFWRRCAGAACVCPYGRDPLRGSPRPSTDPRAYASGVTLPQRYSIECSSTICLPVLKRHSRLGRTHGGFITKWNSQPSRNTAHKFGSLERLSNPPP